MALSQQLLLLHQRTIIIFIASSLPSNVILVHFKEPVSWKTIVVDDWKWHIDWAHLITMFKIDRQTQLGILLLPFCTTNFYTSLHKWICITLILIDRCIIRQANKNIAFGKREITHKCQSIKVCNELISIETDEMFVGNANVEWFFYFVCFDTSWLRFILTWEFWFFFYVDFLWWICKEHYIWHGYEFCFLLGDELKIVYIPAECSFRNSEEFNFILSKNVVI